MTCTMRLPSMTMSAGPNAGAPVPLITVALRRMSCEYGPSPSCRGGAGATFGCCGSAAAPARPAVNRQAEQAAENESAHEHSPHLKGAHDAVRNEGRRACVCLAWLRNPKPDDSRHVTALFRSADAAERGYRAAKALGYDDADINVVTSDATRDRLLADARPSQPEQRRRREQGQAREGCGPRRADWRHARHHRSGHCSRRSGRAGSRVSCSQDRSQSR